MVPSPGVASPRRSAQIARIEALRRERSVGRYEQRLIEPAAWGWLVLTFVASSVALAISGAVGEHLPRDLAILLTGVALFLSVRVVDSLFTVTPPLPLTSAPATAAPPAAGQPGPTAARRTMARATSWTIRAALILLILGGAALVAVFRFATEVPAVDRVAAFLDHQRDAIERSMRAGSVDRAVRGRTAGHNWQLLALDGRYLATPLADAKRLCASLGAGWTTPRREDFAGLAPPPDDPATLHVWVSRGVDRDEPTGTSAQIVAGSWQPAGFLSSKDTGRDRFQVLCVRAGS